MGIKEVKFDVSINTKNSYNSYVSITPPYQDKDFLIIKTTEKRTIMVPVNTIITVGFSEIENDD